MDRIGVIDIGSNSVRLTLAEVENSGYFRIIDELKEHIRLGSDLFACSLLSQEKIGLTISSIKSFKSMCQSCGASKIILIGAESIGQANNEINLKEIIKKKLDLDLRILSNEEEIHYNFLGAKNSLYVNDSLLLDINSNNTHLCWIKNNNIYKEVTLPFGYVTLTSMFELGDMVTFENNSKCVEYIKDNLSKIDWLKENKFHSLIGVGGSFRNLGKVDRRRKRYPIDIVHNYVMYDYDIDEMSHMFKSKNLRQRKKIEGLSQARADVIVASSNIIKQILKFTETKEVIVCGRGLREGIIYEYITNTFHNEDDILDVSLKGIMDTLNINIPHAENVYRLANTLFEELIPLHHLGDEFKNILKTASLLHDCGISIRYYDHHIHSFYVILNSHINGLTHKEILLSALCAAYHRNNSFQAPLAKYSSIINKLDVKHVEHIGVILKLAEGLDRGLTGHVRDLDVIIEDDTVTLKLYSDFDLDLEMRQARRSAKAFLEIYNKNLIIEKA
ncbi:Ppx/GppA phosphatase family protein [Clostridium sp.]|uniref:Ppx/GppA phosphatase family protein n=1 Tax=Clostridium sp. TaxID=1506 RepID=UPI0026389863|nr:Ppx/GppA phosphatase family protein [Clostridium sp.]